MTTLLRLFFIIFIFSQVAFSKQTHFRVSYDPDYAPFSYLENNNPEGLLIDFWKLWAEKNEYTIDFVNGKYWDDSIDLVKNNNVDFFLGAAPYEEWMHGSLTYYTTKTSLFILKEYSRNFTKDANYIIGIVGNDYEEFTKKNFPNSEIIVYRDYSSIFKDFISKKIDLLYDDKIAIEFYALKNSLFHKIRPLYLISDISQIQAIANNKETISIFNSGFRNINADDLYEVESKWILNEQYQVYKRSTNLSKKEKEFIKNNVLKVALSKSWHPFNFEDSLNKPSGISTEIWKALENKLEIKSEYTIFDKFSKQLSSIEKKEQDVIISAGETKERKNYSIFTKPYLTFPLSIVTLKDEDFIENMEYLFDKKIAVGRNFTAHELLKQKYPKLNFYLVDSIKEGLLAVKGEEVYAYIDIKPSLTYNIKKYDLDELKITGNTGLNFQMKIMIRDDYVQLKTILDKAISVLSNDEINSIVDKWINSQFHNRYNYKIIWIGLGVVLFIFLILIYINQINLRRNKKLKQLVDERTKELKLFNKELEHRVEGKTKELRDTNYLLEEAQKIAKLGSFTYDINSDKLRWSDELFRIFNLEPNQIKPSISVLLSYVDKDERKRVKKELLRAFKFKKKYSFEFKIVMKDLSVKYLQVTSKITKYDELGTACFITGTILDLTRIKKLELQKREQDSIMAQQAKMAAMGEMLENIAHQWRQPLSAISTVSTGIQVHLEMNGEIPDELLIENVNSINNHTQYLSKTIDDFRNFFNPNKKKIKFNIKDTIEKTLTLTHARIVRHKINVKKEIEDIEISTFENELIQIFMNIINNAIDALNSVKNDENYIFIKTYEMDEKLCIEIKDNAGGVSRKIIDRIFEPYFTTKHKSQGTGIGLYMSNEIVTKHLHGELKVINESYIFDDKRYKGALFRICIPLNTHKNT